MSDNSQCKTCKRKFGSQRAANQHMDSVNHWIPALECDDQKSLVQRFAELYTGNNPQEPDKSTVPRSETVTATPELQHHTSTQLLEDTKNRQPQFQCKICKKSFLTQRSLDQHLENTGHEGPQFKCDTCDGKFTSQSSANQHMDAKSHHKRHTCPDCKKGFKSENALNMHVNMTTHRDKKVAHPSPSQESITKPHPEHCQNGDRKTLQSAPRVPQLKPPTLNKPRVPPKCTHFFTSISQSH
ncbi:hypothetical protein PTNB73_10272 [Pyrenophora teres f. teres]|nr:hypothetical protein PTNB73_10272 [Pyrenophora teres f. teres]